MSNGVDSVLTKLNRWLEEDEEEAVEQSVEGFIRQEQQSIDSRPQPVGLQPTQGLAEGAGAFGTLARTKTGQALSQPIQQISQATSAEAIEESPIGSILETINAGVATVFSPFSAVEAFVSEQPASPQKFLLRFTR